MDRLNRTAIEAELARIEGLLAQGEAAALPAIGDLMARTAGRPLPRRGVARLSAAAGAWEGVHLALSGADLTPAERRDLLRACLVTGRDAEALTLTAGLDDRPDTVLMLGAAAIATGAAPPLPLPQAEAALAVPLMRLALDLAPRGRAGLVSGLVDALPGDTAALRTRLATVLEQKSLVVWMEGDVAASRHLLEVAIEIARDAQSLGTALWRLTEILMEMGDPEAARVRFAALEALPVTGRVARLREAQRAAFALGASGEPFFDGRVVHTRHGTDACLIFFRNGLPSRASLHVAFLQPILRRRGISLLTVSDERRLGGATGCAGVGEDIPATSAALAGLIGQLGYGRVATMGSSLAGYTALVQGMAIGARGCLSCAGFAEAPRTEDMPTPGTRARARRLWSAAPPAFPVARDLLPRQPGFVLHYLYGTRSPIEIGEHPRFLALSGAVVIGHDTDDHDVLMALSREGEADAIVNRFLDACGLPG